MSACVEAEGLSGWSGYLGVGIGASAGGARGSHAGALAGGLAGAGVIGLAKCNTYVCCKK